MGTGRDVQGQGQGGQGFQPSQLPLSRTCLEPYHISHTYCQNYYLRNSQVKLCRAPCRAA